MRGQHRDQKKIHLIRAVSQGDSIGAPATRNPGLNTAIVHRCTNAGEFCMSPGKSQKVGLVQIQRFSGNSTESERALTRKVLGGHCERPSQPRLKRW